MTFEGYSGEPANASAVAKKKILEKISPDVCNNKAYIIDALLHTIIS